MIVERIKKYDTTKPNNKITKNNSCFILFSIKVFPETGPDSTYQLHPAFLV
jgi:hypothetical protein